MCNKYNQETKCQCCITNTNLLRYNSPTYCNNMLYRWFYHGKLPTGVNVENFTREIKINWSQLCRHITGIFTVYCRYSTGAGKEHLSGHVT